VLTKGWEVEAEGGQGLHFNIASETQNEIIGLYTGSLVTNIEQKPYRNHLAYCMRPYTLYHWFSRSQALQKAKCHHSSLPQLPEKTAV